MSKISKYMSTDLHSINPDRFVFEAVDEMENRKISALLVKIYRNYNQNRLDAIGPSTRMRP